MTDTIMSVAALLNVFLFFLFVVVYLEIKEEQTMERREDDELAELTRLYGEGPVGSEDAKDILELERIYETQ